MRVLVTWGSKNGGTAGIGNIVADELRAQGHEVVAVPAGSARDLEAFDAVIVGAGLYANRWVASARRFVNLHVETLRRRPVWMFSSGPLDDSASRAEIAPTRQVMILAERVGAQGHATFGGRLAPDVKGFPAAAMARTMSGDWRDPERIRTWARAIAAELPRAVPGPAVDHEARSVPRLVLFGLAGWTACALTMALLLRLAGASTAIAIHAVAAPLIFGLLAWRYHVRRGARDPLPTAVVWTGIALGLDLVVAFLSSNGMFRSVTGTWLPLALIFLATWVTGVMLSTLPWPRPDPKLRGA